jgi:hypothetical protein
MKLQAPSLNETTTISSRAWITNEENTKKNRVIDASNSTRPDSCAESEPTYLEAPSKSHENKGMKLALVAPGQDSRDLNRNEWEMFFYNSR